MNNFSSATSDGLQPMLGAGCARLLVVALGGTAASRPARCGGATGRDARALKCGKYERIRKHSRLNRVASNQVPRMFCLKLDRFFAWPLWRKRRTCCILTRHDKNVYFTLCKPLQFNNVVISAFDKRRSTCGRGTCRS